MWTDEPMPAGHPQEVEDSQVRLVWMQPCAATDHLRVQCAGSCGAKDDDGVDGWFVVALGKQHGVADDAAFLGCEPLQDLLAIRGVAIDMLGVEAALDAQVAHQHRGLDERQEDHGLLATELFDLIGDASEVGLDGFTGLRGVEVPGGE